MTIPATVETPTPIWIVPKTPGWSRRPDRIATYRTMASSNPSPERPAKIVGRAHREHVEPVVVGAEDARQHQRDEEAARELEEAPECEKAGSPRRGEDVIVVVVGARDVSR